MGYDYENFKKDVYQLTNINLSLYKERQMKRRIESLMKRKGFDTFDTYFAAMKKDQILLKAFVSYLTINVSEFYRNKDQWDLMDKTVIPKLIKEQERNIKIWSAACSTGDEPYSLAMAFSKHIPLSNIHITATDIDKQVLAKAQVGLYNEKSISGVPEDLKRKYFTKVGNSYQISDQIKKCVTFKEHNLLKDPYPQGFDLILCRNVVIYFTEEAKNMIYQNFQKALKPQGVLFIGSTEQITNYRELGFERLSSFYFEKV